MRDFWQSAQEWFREKTNSPLYFTYILFFIAWNWRLFHVLLFEDYSLFSSPRIEYINTSLNFFLHPQLDWIINFLWHSVPPAIFAGLAIQLLPRVHAWAHQIHIDSHFSRKSAYDRAKLKYEQEKTGKLREEAKEIKEQKEAKKEIDKNLTQEEKWTQEFLTINKDSRISAVLSNLVQAVYSTSGEVATKGGISRGEQTFMSVEHLSKVDTLGLVNLSPSKNYHAGQNLSLTDKGKFFVKLYQNKNLPKNPVVWA